MVHVIQAEYRALMAAGANHQEAVQQIGISYQLQVFYVEATLLFID